MQCTLTPQSAGWSLGGLIGPLNVGRSSSKILRYTRNICGRTGSLSFDVLCVGCASAALCGSAHDWECASVGSCELCVYLSVCASVCVSVCVHSFFMGAGVIYLCHTGSAHMGETL